MNNQELTIQAHSTTANGRRASLPAAIQGLNIARWLDQIASVVVSAHDGVELNVYYAGKREQPALLLINPVGVSVLLLAPLMHYLSRDYFVVSWESRGLPSPNPGGDDMSLTVEDHVSDARSALGHFGVTRAEIVAFCSGTSIALPLLEQGVTHAERAVLISPSVLIDGEVKMTNYQRTVIPIWNEVMTKGEGYCAIISNFMRAAEPSADDLDAQIDYVNRLPFADGKSTYKYAKLHSNLNQTRHAHVFGQLPVPVLLVHAHDDELIHVDVSRFIEGRLKSSNFFVLERGGHFAICKNEQLHHVIHSYLRDPAATVNVGSLA